jgi:hypothetical protein
MDVGGDSGACSLLAPQRDSRLRVQLQSSAVAYRYGISGPWWYGSGATVQVLLFAMVCLLSSERVLDLTVRLSWRPS